MSRSMEWKSYIDSHGDFELANYLYRVILDLMKNALDMGTLLSSDPAKLRAFKEQTKQVFKTRWLEVAQALEAFDIIVPCGCQHTEFCKICGGSRYRLNTALSPDQMREISAVYSNGADSETAKKLEAGLRKALKDPRVHKILDKG
ncbi:MAG TPA: hypothetical protein VJ742_12380 [Nitrososphaera sp.]|nr:hypothetical protein [Nitrososphaera sp.]